MCGAPHPNNPPRLLPCLRVAVPALTSNLSDFALHLSRRLAQTPPRMALHPSGNAPVRRRGLTLLAAFLGWMFDGMEMGIFPLVAGPALREMGTAHGLAAAELGGY